MSKRKAYKPRQDRQQQKAKRYPPLWDLDRDGVTYSLLSKFFVCPERFRLATVEGLTEGGLKAGLEFGNAFHHCLENEEIGYERALNNYQSKLLASGTIFPPQRKDLEILLTQVEGLLHGYKRVWQADDKTKVFVGREEVFDVPYPLPMTDGTTRTVRMRGKFDGVYRELKAKALNLFETKTKGDIDSDGLQRTLPQDLQTMMYCSAMKLIYREPVEGVLYNVVRRPGIRPTQKETLVQYRDRLKADVVKRKDFYFHRFYVQFESGDIEKWQQTCFNPLLRQIVNWWDSIKHNPFDPWASPLHYRRPFGIYDSLADGRRGDFFDYFTTGSRSGLSRKETCFPELEG